MRGQQSKKFHQVPNNSARNSSLEFGDAQIRDMLKVADHLDFWIGKKFPVCSNGAKTSSAQNQDHI